MQMSAEVKIALDLAHSEAARRHNEFLTVEHLLHALCFDDDARKTLRHCGADVDALKKALAKYLDEEMPSSKEPTDPSLSLAVQRLVRRAFMHAQGADKEAVLTSDLLIALFSERDSMAVALLDEQGVTRLDVVQYVSHGVRKVDDDDDDEHEGAAPAGAGDDGEPDDGKKKGEKHPLQAFCLDLVAEAREGRIDPLVGREKEVERTIHILARRRKNNPLLVGDAGVGKTAIVEGLAWKIHRGEVPPAIKDAKVYSLDMGALVAGTRFRGDFEERMKAVLKEIQKVPNSILFIDEIHTILGAGSASGGTLDAANLLKPALSSGRIRCIGSTTFAELRTHF